MYIALVMSEELKDFEFEAALVSECSPRVLLSHGYSKNTQQSRSSCFPTQLWHVDILSYSCQRMMTPSGDRLFLPAAANRHRNHPTKELLEVQSTINRL